MLVFFTNLSHRISGHIFGFISSFLSNKWLRVVLDRSLHKNIQLMLEFLKGLLLVLSLSCYTLMAFLMIVSDLLSMLMILLSILSVIRHLICGNNFNWLLNLSLIYETLWAGAGSGLLTSVLEKLTGSIDMKMDGSVPGGKSSFKMLGLTFSSKLDWVSYIISIAKTASKKIGAFIRSLKFLSPEVAVCL